MLGSKIMLGCIVLGEKNAFPVELDTGKTIGQLKKFIKREAELDSPAHKLKLWKVNIPESRKHEISEGIDIKVKFGGVELDSDLSAVVGDYFKEPTAKYIHIIVGPPATTGKCLPTFYLSNKEICSNKIFFFRLLCHIRQ
jgi:hypothetical protein